MRWNADGFESIVRDHAASHLDEQVQSRGMPLVQQPAYSPELNPAERVNEEIRRFLKGKTFPRLAEKVLVVENLLRQWKANPAYLQRVCGYYFRIALIRWSRSLRMGKSNASTWGQSWRHEVTQTV